MTGFSLDDKIFPEDLTYEALIDRVHGKIMKECPRGLNPHRAVRLYVAQFVYAKRRGLTNEQAELESQARVQIYYNTRKTVR